MTTTIAPVTAPVTPVTGVRRASPRPMRPRAFNRDDVLIMLAAAASSFCLVWLVYVELLPQSGIPGFVFWWYAAFLGTYWAAVRTVRGPLLAKDALMTTLITSGAVAVVVPLVLLVSYVVTQGIGLIAPHFFVDSVQFCGQLSPASCGGVGHAIVGTLEEVAIAVVFAVPLAVLCAVFLNEIGGPLRRPVQIFVDAMSGVPSIVAGLFIYAVWVIAFNRGFNGFGASIALTILMLPTITRTSVEVLRLVPGGLREGALALGASEWRTTFSVVLPTARGGLITAVILGVARAVGETAPLLFTAFGASVLNLNPLVGPQEALPQFVYTYIRFNPGTGPYQRAWSAALVLTFLVLLLFTLARVIGSLTSVESRQRRAARRLRRVQRHASIAQGVS